MKTIQVFTMLSLCLGLTACGGGDNTKTNHTPKAAQASIIVDVDKKSIITLKGSDEDKDTLSYKVLTQPSHGVLKGNAPNLSYKANKGSFSGSDSFTFKVNDGTVDSPESSIKISLVKTTKGSLIAPLSVSASNKKILNKALGVKAKETCTTVPKGYQPLKAVNVDYLDEKSSVIKRTRTDECGGFSATVANNATQIRAKTTNNKDLLADISIFRANGSGVASTIPANASYEITTLQMTSDKTAAFTVVDSQTRNAVIGISSTALSIEVDSALAGISKLSNAAHAAKPASITMLLDASGSMNKGLRDSANQIMRDSNNNPYTLYRIASLATHAYLDNMPVTDETGFVIFDDEVNFINNDSISSLFSLSDLAGNDASYTFSANGYSSDATKLRFIADVYNFYTSLYDLGFDPYVDKHSDSPDLIVTNDYPWLGATAIYDAIKLGVEKTATRTNERKFIILMSDGKDISSQISKDDAINAAIAESIPVHTVAFSNNADRGVLQDIANRTHGSFIQTNGFDLLNAFQSIQTGITFQYSADLDVVAKEGKLVKVTLNYNGETTSREITR